MPARTAPTPRQRITASGTTTVEMDLLAVEEPLEIRLHGEPLVITLRTPGDDLDLVAGFLFSEGVIDGPDDITALAHIDDPLDPHGNTIHVVLASGVPAARRQHAQRHLFASSACGLCGKASLQHLYAALPPPSPHPPPDPAVILDLPKKLRQAQDVFGQTGGLHGAALFSFSGELEILREDIGRHNAVDKLIGWRLREDRIPISDRILLVSGRIGFEIVQKAAIAGIPVLAAVGAPSSLAAQLAHQAKMTLIGFLREGHYNLYPPPP